MNIVLPAIPAGVLVLLAFFAPYLIAVLNGVLKVVRKPWQKKLVTVLVAVVLTAVVLVVYYVWTGDTVPSWPVFVVLALTIISASYALVTKPSASAVEARASGDADGLTRAQYRALRDGA